MISKCQLVKLIQYIHFITVGVILTVPLTLYKPLIAISVYILIPLVLLSYFVSDGKCLYDMMTDKIYGENRCTDHKNCSSNDIFDFWLFNNCKQANIFGALCFIILISFLILYPPTTYFKLIMTQSKLNGLNIGLFFIAFLAIIIGTYFKVKKQMKYYPKCA